MLHTEDNNHGAQILQTIVYVGLPEICRSNVKMLNSY